MRISSSLTALVFGLFTLALNAAELTEYSANYTASANGIKAKAVRSLQRDELGLYHLDNSLVAEFAGRELASLKESSSFLIQGLALQPQTYSYSLQGIGREAKSIRFDWNAQVAVSAEDLDSWMLPLQTNTQDPLSYQAALQLKLENNQRSELEWPIVNGDKIEIQTFKIEGEESLDTAAGLVECVRLIRVREDGASSTTIWLAKNWAYLLTKIEQVNSSGITIVLELESATVGGIAVAN
jgi:hypothetical protein